MIDRPRKPHTSAADFLPETLDLAQLRAASKHCRGCELYRNATQTVFGEGSPNARLLLVGEQPGDQEDRTGHPFVGPAGQLLGDLLEEVGIDREEVYITNAVKHFKWTPRGNRRLHAKPTVREVAACRPWLEGEIAAIEPALIVCLGATAAQSLLGSAFRITRQHGEILSSQWAQAVLATYHPSAVLRAPTPEGRSRMRQDLAVDLQEAARYLRRASV
jgi:DNA polymerase